MTNKTKLEALDRLIEAVEAGSITHHDLDAFIPALGVDGDNTPPLRLVDMALRAYNGSVDAAISTHESLVPWWGWFLDDAPSATLYKIQGGDLILHEVEADTPARSLLLADLKVYRLEMVAPNDL